MEVPIYAAHLLADGRWELVGLDDDPRRPPWRRLAVLGSATTAEPVCEPLGRDCRLPGRVMGFRSHELADSVQNRRLV